MLKTYHPEMGEPKPEGHMEARLAHYGQHYYVTTPMDLKGVGITKIKILTASTLTPEARHKAGWFKFRVTMRAFAKLCETYDVTEAIML